MAELYKEVTGTDPGALTRGLMIMEIKRVINGEQEVTIPQQMTTEEEHVIATPREKKAEVKTKTAVGQKVVYTTTDTKTSTSSRG